MRGGSSAGDHGCDGAKGHDDRDRTHGFSVALVRTMSVSAL
jgi:hypothetical protein